MSHRLTRVSLLSWFNCLYSGVFKIPNLRFCILLSQRSLIPHRPMWVSLISLVNWVLASGFMIPNLCLSRYSILKLLFLSSRHLNLDRVFPNEP